jgi:hypothetical protein
VGASPTTPTSMTENDYNIKRAELDIREAESKLREARVNLETGERKAKAEYDKEVYHLKQEVERAEILMRREIAYLERRKSESEFKA